MLAGLLRNSMPVVATAARQLCTAKSKVVANKVSLSPVSRQGYVAMQFSMSPARNSKMPAARSLRKTALTKRSMIPKPATLNRGRRNVFAPNSNVAKGTVAASSSGTPGSRPGSNSALWHPKPAEPRPPPGTSEGNTRSWTAFGGKGTADEAASHMAAEQALAPASSGSTTSASIRRMDGEHESSTALQPATSNEQSPRESPNSQWASASESTVQSTSTKAYLPDAAALKACSPCRNHGVSV